MKTNKIYPVLFIFALIFSTDAFSQNVDLGKMSKNDREKYLINLGTEITKTYAPAYYRADAKPVISEVKKFQTDDTRPEISKNIGREYYEVSFIYDPTKERLEWNYTSQTMVWVDNGQPYGIFFGNGAGLDFFFEPYKKGIKIPAAQQIPYQQANKIINIFEVQDTTRVQDTTKKK